MNKDNPTYLTELILAQVRGTGFLPSPIPNVVLLHMDRHLPPAPTVYEPCILIIAQGYKICTVNSRHYRYDEQHCLALTLPLPIETETFGSSEEPFLGLAVAVTPALVTELLLQMDEPPTSSATSAPVMSIAMNEELRSVTIRLLEAMQQNERARVLGPGIVRELVYLLLNEPTSAGLRNLAVRDGHIQRIAQAVHVLQNNYTTDQNIASLARDLGMSLTAFHTAFKAVTGLSPLKYLKTIRLHRARDLMVNDGLTAQAAAWRVGYESASQFSREFKRLFGNSPSIEAARLRAHLIQSDVPRLQTVLTFGQ